MKVGAGTNIVRDSSGAEEIDGGKKQATYVMSPPTADRHETLFLPTGWEARLNHFRENPVFIMSHNSWGGPDSLLGRWVEVWVDKKRGLMGRAEYDLDHCELAREVWPMVEAGLIKAVSVAARIWKAVYWDEEAGIKELPPYARKMFKDEEIWAAFTDQELLECSQVLIGSNRQALKQAVARGLCTRSFALGISWEQDSNSRIILPEGARPGVMTVDEARVVTSGEAYAEACELLGSDLNPEIPSSPVERHSVPADEATPETEKGGPSTMAVDPKNYFRSINEIRKEAGLEPVPGGEAVVLPEGVTVRTFEAPIPAVIEISEVAAERVVPPAAPGETPQGAEVGIGDAIRAAVKAEFDAFLAAGGGIAVPAVEAEAPAAEERALSAEDIEEVTDAILDYEIANNRELDAEEKAAFIGAYFAN